MKTTNCIIILCLLIGCITNKKNIVNGEDPPCSMMAYYPEKGDYIFFNWYRADSSVCEISSFKIKDLQGYKKGYFKNGIQNGKWTSDRYYHYDSLGYPRSKRYLGREEYFKNGLRDSIFKIYDKDGKIIYSTSFKQGNGIEKDFYDNGQIYYSITTKNGYFNDTLRIYTKNGLLMKKLFYKKDSLVYEKFY